MQSSVSNFITVKALGYYRQSIDLLPKTRSVITDVMLGY
jgi:hypothetical protein